MKVTTKTKEEILQEEITGLVDQYFRIEDQLTPLNSKKKVIKDRLLKIHEENGIGKFNGNLDGEKLKAQKKTDRAFDSKILDRIYKVDGVDRKDVDLCWQKKWSYQELQKVGKMYGKMVQDLLTEGIDEDVKYDIVKDIPKKS